MNSMSVIRTHFILYVENQDRSTSFYSQVFGHPPSLNEPGMTEFALSENVILGLMPIDGLKRLLGANLANEGRNPSVAYCEVYLLVSNPLDYHQRALEAGAVELSGLKNRDWGHRVAYSLDPDGHVLAFAEQLREGKVG